MDFSEHGQDPTKKLVGISVVVLIHVIVIYALLNGLGKQIIAVIKDIPIETKVIEEVKPPPPPPDAPPPPPKLAAPPPPFIPPPEVQVAQQPVVNTISAVSNVQPPRQDFTKAVAAPPVVAKASGPSVVAAVVDFSTCDKPDYPRNSVRNEEHGTVRIAFLIGLDGRVADSKIEKSSGFRALDAAAKNGLSLCKFKPGTVDGKPQQTWTAVDYVWTLPE
ncbi:energy transducer TonB [Solimicrobium silvestre]|jgi:protein TonB|uniref:TonB family C-terminal domain n=1 Tax=Solimicrobium silvestre TaxID=2099400 RepID=A0A2S9H079_9BURK|nr:energy transducer TonB [Solimicrobium silvestre]PRC93389.1 TonB family C-terminal domain [Solimicrobium silvestre]